MTDDNGGNDSSRALCSSQAPETGSHPVVMVLQRLKQLLQQNATPTGLALSLTVGVVMGMTPAQAPHRVLAQLSRAPAMGIRPCAEVSEVRPVRNLPLQCGLLPLRIHSAGESFTCARASMCVCVLHQFSDIFAIFCLELFYAHFYTYIFAPIILWDFFCQTFVIFGHFWPTNCMFSESA